MSANEEAPVLNQRAVEANFTLPPLVLPQKYKLQADSTVLPATSIPCSVAPSATERFGGAPKMGVPPESRLALG